MAFSEVAAALPRAALERELKFVLPESRADLAGRLLRDLCRPDPRFALGVVSTIYYDTPDLRLLREKLDSDFLKTKVRLRWYDAPGVDPARSLAFLEVKSRVGGLRRKARTRTSLTGEWLATAPLYDAAFTRVLELARTLGAELPAYLVPAVMIRYERRRFVEPVSSARVSLDSGIQARRANRRLLRHGGPVRLRSAVVEVKGIGEELPAALRALTHIGARRASFSKYGEAGLALLSFRP